MDDVTGSDMPASPGINSVLKPPKPRIPLKELLPAAHEEDNTAARKRRVSFANVNKIKEFSAGAESMVVCHTPAYEEPFSVSSDSSCPSGVDGWTPAKYQENPIQATFSSLQKENVMGQTLFMPQIPGYDQIENFRTPLLGSPCLVVSDGMDLTSCVDRASSRGSARFSVGMDLTEVIMNTVNDSGESMDLTKGAAFRQSYQPYLYSTNMNDSDGMSADDSDALELTDAIADPRLIATSTRYSASNMDLTKSLYSVNNTRYSVTGMDLTKGAMSLSSSIGRRSSRFSLSSMDLTEAVGNDYSGLECPEDISEPKIEPTRYSVNDVDLTEAINRDDVNRLTLNIVDCSGAVRNKLENSINSSMESSLDFTRPIYNIHQTTNNRQSIVPSVIDMTKTVEQVEYRKSPSCSATLDSLVLNDSSSNDSEDTPTTQTYNGTEPLSASKGDIAAKEPTEQEEVNKSENKTQDKVDASSSIEIHNLACSSLSGNVVQGKVIEQKLTSECGYDKFSNTERSEISSTKENMESNSYIVSTEGAIILKPDETLEKEHTTLINDKTTDLCKPLVLKNVLSTTHLNQTMNSMKNNEMKDAILEMDISGSTPEKITTKIRDTNNVNSNESREEIPEMDISVLTPEKAVNKYEVVDNMKCNELRDEMLEMDISVMTPEKLANGGKHYFPCKTLNQMAVINDGGDASSVITGENPQNQTLKDESMDLSFSESDLVKKSEEHVDDNKKESCSPKRYDLKNNDGIIKERELYSTEINEEVNKSQNVFNDYLSNKLDNSKSYKEDTENNLSQIDSSLNNLTNPSDVSINTSVASRPCFSNITMTRGTALRYSTDSHNLTVNAGTADIRNDIMKLPSELETSSLMFQHQETSPTIPKTLATSSLMFHHQETSPTIPKTLDISDVESKDHDVLCRKEKGGKRSFEVALEPENDTEESPVKQICLPSAIHIQDCEYSNDISMPSLPMEKSTILCESVPDVHQSTFNSLLTTVNSPTQSSFIDINIGRKSCSEHDQLKMKTKIAVEQPVLDEGHGNNFSLRVDMSNHYNISNTETETLSHQFQHKEKPSFGLEKNEVIVNITSDQLSDSVHLSVSKSNLLQPLKSKDVLHESSTSGKVIQPTLDHSFQPTLDHSFQHNLFSKETTASKIIDNHLTGSIAKQSEKYPAVTLTTANIFRKNRPLRELGESLFACSWIPKWIELYFNVGPNGIVSNPKYKLVCSEEEMAIGEYVLQQVKSTGLPPDVHSLVAEIKEPRNSLPTHMAKNLSLICKYFGGTLKGNTLTLELVSCKQKFWTLVDVNIKYPKYVSAEDITISEQRIGELKLSVVRNIFGRVATGPDQLLHFATALTRLQYE